VNSGYLHLTLRELRDNFQRPVTVASLAGVTIFVGISGPFDTINAFDLPQRIAYWAVVVPMTYAVGTYAAGTYAVGSYAAGTYAVGSYAAGMLGSLLVKPFLHAKDLAFRIAGNSLGSAVVVCLCLGVFNALLGLRFDLRDYALGFLAVYMICLVIECLGYVRRKAHSSQPQCRLQFWRACHWIGVGRWLR
jgi:hypothetical protein